MSELTPHRDRRPLPLQLRDQILETIREEHIGPGDQLPSESALMSRFQVGRSTVREAMRLLERDGRIEVQRGRGSFLSAVAELGHERPITRLEGVTEMMTGLGYTVEHRVLGVHERPATDIEQTDLGLASGDLVVDLERLRLHEGSAYVYSRNAFPRDLFEGPLHAIDWSQSVLDFLSEMDQAVVSSAAHIRAVDCPTRLLELGLDLPPVPWLLISETCLTSTGRPVLTALDYHRSDIFAFHVVRRRAEA